MPPWAAFALALAIGYLLGAIPFGLLLTQARGMDIRRIGSHSIGATNVLRTGNKGLAAATLLLDVAKGAAAVLLVACFVEPIVAAAAGLGAVLGHMFPIWLNLRGGKGVATGLGVLLVAMWPVALICCGIWAVVATLTRMSSAASLAASVAAPALAHWLADPTLRDTAIVLALLVIMKHAGNIRRLVAGTEPRIGATK
jgi:glycerol-3-phosphate acyltransferase PlsY